MFNKYLKFTLTGLCLCSSKSFGGIIQKDMPQKVVQTLGYEGKYIQADVSRKISFVNNPPQIIVSSSETVGVLRSDLMRVSQKLKEPFKIPSECVAKDIMFVLKEKVGLDGFKFERFGFVRFQGFHLRENMILIKASNLINSAFFNLDYLSFENLPDKFERKAISCFVHPGWEECYDERYDIALLFISEFDSVKNVDELFIKVAQAQKDASIKFKQYYDCYGKVRNQILYHSSTSKEEQKLHLIKPDPIQPEQAETSEEIQIRRDLLPFIDYGIERFLIDEKVRESQLKEEVEEIIRENELAQLAELKKHRKEGE